MTRRVLIITAAAILLPGIRVENLAAQSIDAKPAEREGLADGMYLVLQMDEDAKAIQAADGQRVVKQLRTPDWGKTDPAQRFLLLKTKPDVPLRLAAEPKIVVDQQKLQRLNVRMVASDGERLSKFTKLHLGGSIAVLIDEKVVLVATIRSEITGPDVQVSFCAEGSAEQLKEKLSQQLKQSTKGRPK